MRRNALPQVGATKRGWCSKCDQPAKLRVVETALGLRWLCNACATADQRWNGFDWSGA